MRSTNLNTSTDQPRAYRLDIDTTTIHLDSETRKLRSGMRLGYDFVCLDRRILDFIRYTNKSQLIASHRATSHKRHT